MVVIASQGTVYGNKAERNSFKDRPRRQPSVLRGTFGTTSGYKLGRAAVGTNVSHTTIFFTTPFPPTLPDFYQDMGEVSIMLCFTQKAKFVLKHTGSKLNIASFFRFCM